MATLRSFEELDVWQKARILTQEIYRITTQEAFSRDSGLKDQIRRSSVSIMSNIAEGFGRDGTREFIHFLSIAKGSAAEVKSQLYIALDEAYMTEASFIQLRSRTEDVTRLLAGLIHYLRRTKHKGLKYRT